MEETIDLQSASSIVYNKNSSDAQMEGTIQVFAAITQVNSKENSYQQTKSMHEWCLVKAMTVKVNTHGEFLPQS